MESVRRTWSRTLTRIRAQSVLCTQYRYSCGGSATCRSLDVSEELNTCNGGSARVSLISWSQVSRRQPRGTRLQLDLMPRAGGSL